MLQSAVKDFDCKYIKQPLRSIVNLPSFYKQTASFEKVLKYWKKNSLSLFTIKRRSSKGYRGTQFRKYLEYKKEDNFLSWFYTKQINKFILEGFLLTLSLACKWGFLEFIEILDFPTNLGWRKFSQRFPWSENEKFVR